MFGIHYLRSSPTTYVMRYKGGRLVDFGAGLRLCYFGPTSAIVWVPLTSQYLPLWFEHRTMDHQGVVIQGNVTYRVVAPERLAQQLDFTVDPRGRYLSDDPNNLRERLKRLIQSRTHIYAREQTLREILSGSSLLADYLARDSVILNTASGLGLEIESFTIVSIGPDPELASSLRAEARQRLLSQLIDQAG